VLFNPVYTYLHYGKMTPPAHGQFDTMFVHPPAQYFFIAMLMRTGLSVYHAAGALSVLLFMAFSYVDGLLQLRGFFFADRKDYEQFGVATTGVSYMLYAVERPQQLVGYGVSGQTIYRFQEQPSGD
jgi:hypothetical protein